MNRNALLKVIWEEYYYVPSSKTVTKVPPGVNSNIMFVDFIMEPLVKLYNKIFTDEVIANTALLRQKHAFIKEKLSEQMPMKHGILKMVVDHIPSPDQAQKHRYKIFCPQLGTTPLKPALVPIKQALELCSASSSFPTIVYVTKMQPFSARLYDLATRSD